MSQTIVGNNHPDSQGTDAVLFSGAPGSPYTRKMLSVLRYRHIPHRLIIDTEARADLPQPKVHLLPTFYLPDDHGTLEAVVDSTPLIRRFEREYPQRSIIPEDPVLAFIDALLEDYGDEWLTKAMFHYRWHYAADIERAGEILPRWRGISAPEAKVQQMKKVFQDRQISRLWVVGSNDTTAPVIENSYRRYLNLMTQLLEKQKFLLGDRPASSDFAHYGQLTQLVAFDPTPMAIAYEEAPRVCAWVQLVDDLSGLPANLEWNSREQAGVALKDLLTEVGRVYAPALLANHDAIQNSNDQVETVIDGLPWTQKPFPYQAKCLMALRVQYYALDDEDRQQVDALLEGTGCEAMFTKPG